MLVVPGGWCVVFVFWPVGTGYSVPIVGEDEPTQGTDDDPLLGRVFADRYRLEAAIGEGGIGRVYRARHLTLGNHVAIKVLLAQYQDQNVLRKRFDREASALAELNHPNIVRIGDFGLQDGMPFLVMELLEGEDLAAVLDRGPMPPSRAFPVMRQILRALAFAHRRGVVHRDMKPHNVFIRRLDDGTDHVHLLDFGLVRFQQTSSADPTALTRAGTVLGTPAYMAPEQASGDPASAPADVYSCGIILYELLTGRRPFMNKSPGDLLRAHLLIEPPALSEANPRLSVPPALQALMTKALAKTASARYANAAEMLEAFDRLAEPELVQSGIATAATIEASADVVSVAVRSGPDAAPSVTTPARPLGHPASHSRSPTAERGDGVQLGGIGLPPKRLLVGGIVGFLLISMLGMLAVAQLRPAVERPTEPPLDEVVEPATRPSLVEQLFDSNESEVPMDSDGPSSEASPLAGELPRPLGQIKARLARGRGLARSDFRTLNRYRYAHPEDARARLLLGQHYTDVRSLSYAMPEYREALRLNPNAKHDPDLLTDLLEMVRSNNLHAEARSLVTQVYGRAALPAVEQQLVQVRRRQERQNLERLKHDLEAL